MPSTTLDRVAHPSVLPLELTFDADPDSKARISPQQAVSSKDTVSLSGCSQSPTTSEFPLFRQSSSSTIDIAVQRLATTSSGKPSILHSRARGPVQPPLRPLPPPPTRPATHRSPTCAHQLPAARADHGLPCCPSSIRTLVMESPGSRQRQRRLRRSRRRLLGVRELHPSVRPSLELESCPAILAGMG